MAQSKLTNGSNTPLRYPGGKGKITHFVANVLETNHITGTYIEPFAGGAGVAINLLLSGRVDAVIINDLDDGVYSFWYSLVNEPEYLLREIDRVPFDYSDEKPTAQSSKYSEYWKAIRKRYDFNHYSDIRRKGFDFFMLNRMNVSGVIKGGPIGGAAQDGKYNISSRFNKSTLKKRIERIAAEKERITVSNLEASHFFKLLSDGKFCDMKNSLIFADPPFTMCRDGIFIIHMQPQPSTLWLRSASSLSRIGTGYSLMTKRLKYAGCIPIRTLNNMNIR